MVAERRQAVEIFIFYAPEDGAMLDALEKHLAAMREQGKQNITKVGEEICLMKV
jgi:hypothetical protein